MKPLALALAALVLAALALASSGCGGDSGEEPTPAAADTSNDKLAQVRSRGTLVGSHEPDYPPQSMGVEGAERPAATKCAENQLTGNQVTGFDIETTKLVAKALGVEACFVSPAWTALTAGNWGDRWDIAYGSGAITADRMKRLYMTQPYYAVPNYYFVRAGSRARHASDLDGKRIGACAGCSHEAYLKGELETPGEPVRVNVRRPEVVLYETEGPGLAALAKGRVDAFLAADPVGRARIKEGAKLRRLPEVAFTEYLSGFVDRASGLRVGAFTERVNSVIRRAQKDGTLEALSRKWFGRDYVEAAAGFELRSLKQVVK